MELTDRQRKLLFAGLVVVLAAVGVFLTFGGGDDGHARAKRSATPAPSSTVRHERAAGDRPRAVTGFV